MWGWLTWLARFFGWSRPGDAWRADAETIDRSTDRGWKAQTDTTANTVTAAPSPVFERVEYCDFHGVYHVLDDRSTAIRRIRNERPSHHWFPSNAIFEPADDVGTICSRCGLPPGAHPPRERPVAGHGYNIRDYPHDETRATIPTPMPEALCIRCGLRADDHPTPADTGGVSGSWRMSAHDLARHDRSFGTSDLERSQSQVGNYTGRSWAGEMTLKADSRPASKIGGRADADRQRGRPGRERDDSGSTEDSDLGLAAAIILTDLGDDTPIITTSETLGELVIDTEKFNPARSEILQGSEVTSAPTPTPDPAPQPPGYEPPPPSYTPTPASYTPTPANYEPAPASYSPPPPSSGSPPASHTPEPAPTPTPTPTPTYSPEPSYSAPSVDTSSSAPASDSGSY